MAKTEQIYAHNPRRWHAWGYILFGMVTIVGLFGGMTYWSMNTEIHGAVVTQGQLRVETNSKPVQHYEGGIVDEILVRNGDQVSVGDVLVRLEPTMQEASFAIVDSQVVELEARMARLLAERDEAERIVFSDATLRRAQGDPEAEKGIRDQRKLFAARLESYRQRRAQLGQRIEQLKNEIIGARSRRTSFDTQQVQVNADLRVQQQLLDKGLTTRRQITQLLRDKAQIAGEIGALIAEEARLQRQIQETELEISQLRETRREEAIAELRDVEVRLAEQRQRMIVAEDALKKIEIKAPHGGVIEDVQVFGQGAVVGPGEPIMTIVPTSDRLVLEARVPTNKIDEVEIGREARVRFSAFNQRTTPELNGEVLKLSSTSKMDEQSGQTFYTVEVLVPEDERARLGEENVLRAGMPAEIYIMTDKRTPLSYLLKPLTDNLQKVGREE